jgi:hypothetical protein
MRAIHPDRTVAGSERVKDRFATDNVASSNTQAYWPEAAPAIRSNTAGTS